MKENKNLKEFKIPVFWEVCGYISVEAESAEDALDIAYKIEYEGDGFPLPEESKYVDGSFKIEEDIDYIKFLTEIDE